MAVAMIFMSDIRAGCSTLFANKAKNAVRRSHRLAQIYFLYLCKTAQSVDYSEPIQITSPLSVVIYRRSAATIMPSKAGTSSIFSLFVIVPSFADSVQR